MTRLPFFYSGAVCFVAFACGIVCVEHVHWAFGWWLCAALAFVFVWSMRAFYYPRFNMIFLFCAWIALGGLWAKSCRILPQNDLVIFQRKYDPGQITAEGRVCSFARIARTRQGVKTSFDLCVERLQWGREQTSDFWRGKIIVNVFRQEEISFGERLRVSGKLHYPFSFSEKERFSYRDYLALRGIRLMLSVKKAALIERLPSGTWDIGRKFWSRLEKIKTYMAGVFDAHLSIDESGVMKAFLLGDRQDVREDLRIIFEQTGTAHVLAISGLHVGILSAVVFAILRMFPFPRSCRAVFLIGFLVFYVFLTGSRISIVRTALMSAGLLLALLWERQAYSLNTICWAAFLILMGNPFFLFDAGFQLSFGCVVSIVLLTPGIAKQLSAILPNAAKHKLGYWLIQSFSCSAAVWVGVTPLVAYHFQIISPISLFANIVVIPLVTAVIALGFGMIIFSWSGAFVTACFAACLKLFLHLMVTLIWLLSRIPGAYQEVPDFCLWHAGLCYGSLIGVICGVIFLRKCRVEKCDQEIDYPTF